MMGVPFDGPTYEYVDNMSVVYSTQCPASFLSKNSNYICYHAVTESAIIGESLIGHMPSMDNPMDICTNDVPRDHKHDHFVGLLLHDIID
jgi:hypothetical protein